MTTTNFVIYTIANCGYCDKAKELLRENGETFHDVAVDMKPDLAISVVARTNRRTWPQIFANDMFIGGYTELKQLMSYKDSRKD